MDAPVRCTPEKFSRSQSEQVNRQGAASFIRLHKAARGKRSKQTIRSKLQICSEAGLVLKTHS